MQTFLRLLFEVIEQSQNRTVTLLRGVTQMIRTSKKTTRLSTQTHAETFNHIHKTHKLEIKHTSELNGNRNTYRRGC